MQKDLKADPFLSEKTRQVWGWKTRLSAQARQVTFQAQRPPLTMLKLWLLATSTPPPATLDRCWLGWRPTTCSSFEIQRFGFLKDGCLLSVVTGPTTSGTTALLVRRRVPPLSALSQSLVWYVDGTAWKDDTTPRQDRHVQEHIKDRGEWIHACHFVRCLIAVAVYQGQHPVRIPLDEERYNAVVECCALKPDLQMMRRRLGLGLLGGQKAR